MSLELGFVRRPTKEEQEEAKEAFQTEQEYMEAKRAERRAAERAAERAAGWSVAKGEEYGIDRYGEGRILPSGGLPEAGIDPGLLPEMEREPLEEWDFEPIRAAEKEKLAIKDPWYKRYQTELTIGGIAAVSLLGLYLVSRAKD